MESQQGFVEEIDIHEISFYEVVGKGAFGVVSRAKWRNKDVAVKLIETESERKAFLTELKQLSRVNHPNIVKLYGACNRPPTVCLVMEYAEGGSLYNVLHGAGPQPAYNAAHAMSWALQCAKGVEYLHSMKPKALIHRDLKPPNLLLIMGGTVLKICDFGTACDIQTHMTNNKGSAAWMAPEVFEGSNYSEKCDVFSWGIIIWEIFTRRKPFDEIGGPAFRIMWAVHNGTRPPLIQKFPKPLDILMTRCWSGIPADRPSMAEVVRIMSHLYQFFTGADEFLVYPQYDESPDYTFSSPPQSSQFSTPQSIVGTTNHPQAAAESRTSTFSETVRHSGEPAPFLTSSPCRSTPPVLEEENRGPLRSAPPSLAASRESLVGEGRGFNSPRSVTPVDHYQKRYSADLSKLEEYEISEGDLRSQQANKVRGHRRSGSHGNPTVFTAAGIQLQPSSQTGPRPGRGHRRIGSDEYMGVTHFKPGPIQISPVPPPLQPLQPPVSTPAVHQVSTFPGALNTFSNSREATPPQQGGLSVARDNNPPPVRSVSYNPSQSPTDLANKTSVRSSSWTADMPVTPLSVNVNLGPADGSGTGMMTNPLTNQAMNLVYQALDHQYQPIAPCPSSSESMEIFQKHCQLAQQYLRYQTEIAMFEQQRHELKKELEEDVMNVQSSTQLSEEYWKLSQENESLKSFHKNLVMQLEQIRKKQQSHNKHHTAS